MSAEADTHERWNRCRVKSETVEENEIITKSIKGQRSMIATLENGMEDQRKKLASVTKTSGDTDDDDSNSSSEPDDESVSKSVNPDDNNESSDSE